MRLDLFNKLSLSNWDKALRQFPFTARKGWSKELIDGGLVINLSKVGWVEPVAALRVVLFVEAALLEGLSVTINLPSPVATAAEQRVFDQASQSRDPLLQKKARNIGSGIRRRLAAWQALRDLRFKEALTHSHLEVAPGTLAIFERDDLAVNPRESKPQWAFEVVYGLQWIPDPRSNEGKKIIDHLAGIDVLADILTHPSQRVSAADGATLAHVFLKELVENTIDHSGCGFALIAALRRPRGYDLKADEIYQCERDFASWCRSYPLIEIMAGDSGSGIPHSLAKEFKTRRPPAPEKLKSSSINTRILAWAFDKWSSKSSTDSKRGTRGLYRAERIVRKYDGCITLRSESSYVGIECGFNDPPDFIYEQGLPRSPGTIVHVRLPVIPTEKLPARPSNPALHRANIEVIDFYGLNWNRVENALDFICEEIRRRSENKSSSRHPNCLILDFGFAKIERRTLEQLLIRLVRIAHPVALVVANVKAPSPDSASETIHSIAHRIAPQQGSNEASAEVREALNVRDAILFQYTDGSFAWVGAQSNISAYLDLLWEKEVLNSSQLADKIPSKTERNEVIRQFAEAYHVAHRVDQGAGIALNFNKGDIREKLQEHVASVLRGEISTGRSRAIRVGKFRTPSLEIVSKYTKVKMLLEEIGLDRATAVLAQKCASVEIIQQAERLQVIADWKTSRDVLESFRDNLCEAIKFPKKNLIIGQINAGDVPDIRDGSQIILFTDIMLAGDLVSSLISQIVRTRTTPTLIATTFDARPDEARGKPLMVMGRPINVISIAEIDISVKHPARSPEPTNISPITHEPEAGNGKRDYDYPITDKLLTRMIEQEDALYFDHIVRHGRHFCFYLDPFKLLGALDTDDPYSLSEDGRQVVGKFEEEIDEWLSPGQKLSTIYFPNLPRSERPSPTKLIIGQKLAEKYGARLVPISSLSDISLPLPELLLKRRVFQYRSTRYDGGLLQPVLFDSLEEHPARDSSPASQETQDYPQRALIVDWGSITGTAIRGSIRYAAAKGADQILVLTLLSQLPFDEERFLASLTQIGSVVKNKGIFSTRNCEVRVRFLSRYPIQVYDPRLCPYCRQLDRLEEEERFYPSRLLADFIKEAKVRLRPRLIDGEEGIRDEHRRESRTKAKEDTPKLTDPDRNVVRIAGLRNQLETARTWTSARWDLYQELNRLTVPLSNDAYDLRVLRGCLVRLLAVEWLWLKQEPLSMIKFKKQISEIAINVIKDDGCSERERLDAIVVLRTASKDAFAQRFPDIFNALILDDKTTAKQTLSLISQLLYCAFTYLQRDYLMSGTLEPLVKALSKSASRVHELLGQPKQGIALRVGRTVNSLHQYGRFLVSSLNHVTAPDAWDKLKTQLGSKYHIHHPVPVALDSLRFGALEEDIENSLAVPPIINWDTKRKSWENKCVPFIIVTILPLLTPLREVFEGLDANIIVGENRAETLAIVERKLFKDVATISHSLAVFASNPTAVQQPGLWKDFVQARDYIWHLLIDPGEIRPEGSRDGGSALVRLIQDCPTDILSATQEFTAGDLFKGKLKISIENSLSSNNALAFCHADVLRETIAEMLRNVSRHVSNIPAKGYKDSDGLQISSDALAAAIPVEIRLSDDDQHLFLSIKNGGFPIESQVRGRGLEMCSERLSPYGATVIAEDNLQLPWVFGVTLTFLRG